MVTNGFDRTITKVERIQHKLQWQRYATKVRAKSESNGNANEVCLKHGTRATDPTLIWQSDGGIDFRYSQAGMYGNGAYFAYNATYSHSYRYDLPRSTPACAQILLAKVAAGRIEDRLQYNAECRQIRVPAKGHHSVKGTVATNHPALIVYEPNQSYPMYLVTYNV
jgi:hypothetical protein